MSDILVNSFAIRSFTPSDIASLWGWWDASQETDESDGAAIATLTDRSTGGRDVTQGTAGLRPIYRATGLNSRPSADFDGTDDILSVASVTLAQPFTVAAVAIVDTTGSARNFFSAATGTVLLGTTNANPPKAVMYGGANLLSSNTTPAGTPFKVLAFYNGASSKIRLNGTETTGAANPGGFSATALRIGGASLPWDGDIGELIVFNAVLNADEITQVEDYLTAKWGL